MKFSEAVAKLEIDPDLKFKSISVDGSRRMTLRVSSFGRFTVDVYTYDTGALISSDLLRGRFNGNIRIDSDWTQVIEPVDFMTAINSGKRIKPAGSTGNFMTIKSLNGCMLGSKYKSEEDRMELINGKWIIEE